MTRGKSFKPLVTSLVGASLLCACAAVPDKKSPKPDEAKVAFAAGRNVGRAAQTAYASKTEILKELKLLQKNSRIHAKNAVKNEAKNAATQTARAEATSAAAQATVANSGAEHTMDKTQQEPAAKTLKQNEAEAADIAEKIESARNEISRNGAVAKRGENSSQAPAAKPESVNAALPRSPIQAALEDQAKPKPSKVPVLVNPEFATGEIATDAQSEVTVLPSGPLKSIQNFRIRDVPLSKPNETPLIFELPVTYNERVKSWLQFFQNQGRHSFKRWLERSTRWLPYIEKELDAAGLPQDLIYVAMIESGFATDAVSPAKAVGMWQFIRPTANRYGLKTDWWLDERRDAYKSTKAAIAYIKDLYNMFGSWYLVAASYNMGEGGVRRLVKRHGSNDFWELANKRALPEETKNYVPKILAAMLIAKAPGLYGFRDLRYQTPHAYEYFTVPGGTDLSNLASYLGVSGKHLQELNPELIRGLVPQGVPGHKIRIPKGAVATVSQYLKMQTDSSNN